MRHSTTRPRSQGHNKSRGSGSKCVEEKAIREKGEDTDSEKVGGREAGRGGGLRGSIETSVGPCSAKVLDPVFAAESTKTTAAITKKRETISDPVTAAASTKTTATTP